MIADNYVRFVLALAAVIVLIFAVAWVARRLGLAGRLVSVGGKRRRLAVVEVLPLDAKRRLVLLRRDGAEHLVLIGLGGDVVIERGIGAPAADAAATIESAA